MKRRRMSKRANKRNFSYTARRVHKKNIYKGVSRGGIRL